MRFLSLLLVSLVASTIRADEPKLPFTAVAPQTLYAQAKMVDGKSFLVLKVLQYKPETRTETVTEYVLKEEIVDGKKVQTKTPVTKTVQFTVMVPTAWSKSILELSDKRLSFFDHKGDPVKTEDALKKLDKEVPVLVTTEAKIDPHHLLTVKEGTIVISGPNEMLYPAPKPVPPMPPK